MNRKQILDAAIECVTKTRQDQHGNPENTFSAIADLWDTFLFHRFQTEGIALTPADVSWMMVLFKVARSIGNPKTMDSYVDAAGYSALAGELGGEQ